MVVVQYVKNPIALDSEGEKRFSTAQTRAQRKDFRREDTGIRTAINKKWMIE